VKKYTTLHRILTLNLIFNLILLLCVVIFARTQKDAFFLGYTLPRWSFMLVEAGLVTASGWLGFALRRQQDGVVKAQGNLEGVFASGKRIFVSFLAILVLALAELTALALLGAVNAPYLTLNNILLNTQLLYLFVSLVLTLSILGGLLSAYKALLLSVPAWGVIKKPLLRLGQKLPLYAWFLLIFPILAAGILWVFSPALGGRVPNHDSGIFMYFGSRILKGDIPFRDLWDHKPPLIFYIDALGLLINPSAWGVWILELAGLILSTFFLFEVLRRELSLSSVFLALAGMLANVVIVIEGGNLTEEFGFPFQCLALWIFYSQVVRPKKDSPRAWVLMGASMGLALMLKQTLIGIWIAIVLYSIYQYFRGERLITIKSFFLFAGGAGLVCFFWAAYFASQNALWDFWDVAFRYNFIYSDIAPGERLGSFGDIFGYLLTVSWYFCFGLAAWCALLALKVRRSREIPALLVLALIDFPLEIVMVNVSGRNLPHYFYVLLPSVTILIAYAWEFLQQKGWLALFPFKSLAMLFTLLLMARSPLIEAAQWIHTPPDAWLLPVINYVQASTAPDERVLMWGSQSVVNFMADRAAPTRFVHQRPLFYPGYASRELSAELLNDLVSKPPRLIINTSLPDTPFLTMDSSGQCTYPETAVAGMPEIYRYICDHYVLAGTVGRDQWQVLRLR